MLAIAIIGFLKDASPSFTGQELSIPVWVWLAIAFSGIPIAQFLAFHKVRKQREALQKQLDQLRDELLGNLSVNNLYFGFGKLSEDSIDVQPGIRLLNSASVAIRYNVTEISAIVSNRAISNPMLRMRTGVIQSGNERLFLYAVITDVPNKFPTECTIKYTIQYGLLAGGYSHELSETLTVTLAMSTGQFEDRRVSWVYLTDCSEYRRL